MSHSSSPGSTVPERVAITSPSIGVNPIVVSTDRPVADRRQRRAGAQVAGDEPQAVLGAAQQLGRAARGAGVGEPVEAEAPQAVALGPLGRQRVRRGGGRHPGVERGVETRHRRHVGQRRRDGLERVERRRLVQRRERRERAQLLHHPAVQAHRPVNRRPPCTMRWPTASARPSRSSAAASSPASARPRVASSSSSPASRSSPSSRRSFSELEPALTVRTLSTTADGTQTARADRIDTHLQ